MSPASEVKCTQSIHLEIKKTKPNQEHSLGRWGGRREGLELRSSQGEGRVQENRIIVCGEEGELHDGGGGKDCKERKISG